MLTLDISFNFGVHFMLFGLALLAGLVGYAVVDPLGNGEDGGGEAGNGDGIDAETGGTTGTGIEDLLGTETEVDASTDAPDETTDTTQIDPTGTDETTDVTDTAEIIEGTEEDDLIYGTDGDETLSGSQANDTIYGGGGDDVIDGAHGDDLVIGGDGNDTLSGGIGEGIRDYYTRSNPLAEPDGDDTLIGGAGDDLLYGGPGHDTLTGGEGSDVFQIATARFGDMATITDFNPDEDQLIIQEIRFSDLETPLTGSGLLVVDWPGGSGADLLYDGHQIASITGAQGLDPTLIEIVNGVYGSNGDDTLNGDDRDDRLSGGPGDDTLNGGEGNDVLSGDGGYMYLSQNGFHRIGIGSGDDTLNGGDGDDWLRGNNGNDTLNGGDGDDRLDGGAGNNILSGGGGDDVFRIEVGNVGGVATITDFDPSQDTIELDEATSSAQETIERDGSSSHNTVAIEDWHDGTGADVLVNGVIRAHVTGAQGLDPALINFYELV